MQPEQQSMTIFLHHAPSCASVMPWMRVAIACISKLTKGAIELRVRAMPLLLLLDSGVHFLNGVNNDWRVRERFELFCSINFDLCKHVVHFGRKFYLNEFRHLISFLSLTARIYILCHREFISVSENIVSLPEKVNTFFLFFREKFSLLNWIGYF